MTSSARGSGRTATRASPPRESSWRTYGTTTETRARRSGLRWAAADGHHDRPAGGSARVVEASVDEGPRSAGAGRAPSIASSIRCGAAARRSIASPHGLLAASAHEPAGLRTVTSGHLGQTPDRRGQQRAVGAQGLQPTLGQHSHKDGDEHDVVPREHPGTSVGTTGSSRSMRSSPWTICSMLERSEVPMGRSRVSPPSMVSRKRSLSEPVTAREVLHALAPLEAPEYRSRTARPRSDLHGERPRRRGHVVHRLADTPRREPPRAVEALYRR
jgi:hypothetical protein